MFSSRLRRPGRGRFGPRLSLQFLEERVTPAQLLVTSSLDNDDLSALRSIIAIANSNGEADTITFAAGLTSITLVSGQLTISEGKDLTIDGGGTVTINGAATASATNRLFNITALNQPTIAMRNITLANGNLMGTNASGGAISMSNQNLALTNAKLINNRATGPGGAIDAEYAKSIHLEGTTFDSNTSQVDGGAIYSWRMNALAAIGCSFTNNQASRGGALCINPSQFDGDPAIELKASTFSGNKANSSYGGALFLSRGVLDMQDVVITNNMAQQGGGGVLVGYLFAAKLVTVSNCVIANNTGGGGLYVSAANIALSDSTIAGNQVLTSGAGGVGLSGGLIAIANCTISKNVAKTVGGGALLQSAYQSSATITVTNSVFSENTVTSGNGGGLAVGGTLVEVANCTFDGNSATTGAGGIAGGGTKSTYSNCTVTGNSGGGMGLSGMTTVSNCTIADNLGSGIKLISGTTATINNTTVSGNVANSNGAGIQFSYATITVNNCTIARNIVNFADNGSGGGGLFAYHGTATINDSSVVQNVVNSFGLLDRPMGGGISISGNALTINNSNISNNEVNSLSYYADGGGVYANCNVVSINNSTISQNTVSALEYWSGLTSLVSNGGGLYAYFSTSGTAKLSITNSTVFGNRVGGSGGGLFMRGYSPSNLIIRNSTIVGNEAKQGGGIDGAAGTLESSIVADNLASTFRDLSNSVLTGNNNLVGVLDTPGSLIGSNNLTGTKNDPLNPGLMSFGNYGGPNPVVGLKSDSPAIDHGSNPAALFLDQRGQPRESPTGLPDIGAFEFNKGVPYVAVVTPFPDITATGSWPLIVVITFDGPNAINPTTFGNSDLVISGPRTLGPLTFMGSSVSGTKVTATYFFNPTNGFWEVRDSGTYTIQLVPNQVFDSASPAVSVPAQPLGSFRVQIAGQLIVDSKDDSVDGDFSPGHFTLREALQVANAISSTMDTITFDTVTFSSPTTIVLGSELPVTGPVSIVGPGANLLTMTGNNVCRIFNAIRRFEPMSMSLSGLTLSNGKATGNGGAILSTAQLTISDCILRNNRATYQGGAVSISGLQIPLSIDRSVITGNTAGSGGGIYVYSADVFIIASTISSNSAIPLPSGGLGYGGGVAFDYSSKVAIADSVFFGNSARVGGAFSLASASNSTYAISNTTISGNSAASVGGGLVLFGTSDTTNQLNIRNSTITANSALVAGGGIRNESSTKISMTSSIVASNQSPDGPDLSFKTAGSVISNNNLVGIADVGNFTLVGTGNFNGTLAAPLDPQLAPLADNGGATKTHALLPGSPAFNSGSNPANLILDQRGKPRSVGVIDIGAYEAQVPQASISVNGGASQRSIVTQLEVTFSEPVVFPDGMNAAFQLQRIGPGGPTGLVNLAFAQVGNFVTLTFDDSVLAPAPGKSLIDGNYSLTLIASKIQGAAGLLDGNGDGIPGDDQSTSFHRLFGDSNGDRRVTAIDYNAFRSAWATNNTTFDFNNDGIVTAADFNQFRTRFGVTI